MALAATLVCKGFPGGSVTTYATSGFTPNSGDVLLADVTFREAVGGGAAPVASIGTSHGGVAWTCVATIDNGAGTDSALARFAARFTTAPTSDVLNVFFSESSNRQRYAVTKVSGGAALPANTGVASSTLGSPVVSLASIQHDPDSLLIASIVSPGSPGGIAPGAGWSELTEINSADDTIGTAFQVQTRGPPPGTVFADWTGAQSGGAGNVMMVTEVHLAAATVNAVAVDDTVFFDDTDARTHLKVFTDPVVF